MPLRSHKGRGAVSDREGRFASRPVEFDEDEAIRRASVAPETVVKAMQARSIISHNDSPDIPFDQSINPFHTLAADKKFHDLGRGNRHQARRAQTPQPNKTRRLKRCRATRPLDGVSAQERHDMLKDAIAGHPKRAAQLHGHPVLLVDDVMTSGATLTACTQACHALGATQVSVAVLARVDRTG